ncbi:hypothetical protein BpHYR1_051608 [Brachionus plicatilis]|uniref:Uncharacterized protein n=1 Tax=Brachionus plicatilis TaxID=10195 RepID=A0A3M7QZB0_BRAPC|nr:hypothetical protein BpHYR1_051608 [Brachionus plicatilis]
MFFLMILIFTKAYQNFELCDLMQNTVIIKPPYHLLFVKAPETVQWTADRRIANEASLVTYQRRTETMCGYDE